MVKLLRLLKMRGQGGLGGMGGFKQKANCPPLPFELNPLLDHAAARLVRWVRLALTSIFFTP